MSTPQTAANSSRTIILKSTNASMASLELEAAVLEVEQCAIIKKQHGVLVTRRDDRTFTIEISPRVPYGQTLEQWS